MPLQLETRFWSQLEINMGKNFGALKGKSARHGGFSRSTASSSMLILDTSDGNAKTLRTEPPATQVNAGLILQHTYQVRINPFPTHKNYPSINPRVSFPCRECGAKRGL